MIISRTVDPHLRLVQMLSAYHSVILTSKDQGFEANLDAIRAGVRASLASPLDMVELDV